MMTWARVDLPDPLGPITACTSPEDTSRSTPRRISWESTPARSPDTTSLLIVLLRGGGRVARTGGAHGAGAPWEGTRERQDPAGGRPAPEGQDPVTGAGKTSHDG